MMQHFTNNMFNSADYQRLSAAAVLLAIVIIILIALLFFVENIFGKGRGRMKKKTLFFPHGLLSALRGVRAFVPAADGSDHHELLHDAERDHGQLRPGL